MSGQRSARIATAVALVAAVVFAALPSAALAVPPSNDNYASALRVNQPGTTLTRDTGFLNFTTTDATLQQFEIDQAGSCAGYDYGATVHFEVYPDRPGIVEVGVYSAAFFASVALWRFTPDGNIHEGECGIASLTSRLADVYYPNLASGGRVQEGQGYNIQIGGLDPDGAGAQTFGSGAYQVRFIFYPDTDRDGLLDVSDRCPNLGGKDVAKHEGCPDEDGDNFAEGPGGNDLCPGLTGRDVAKYQGCPDDDGDKYPEGAGGNDLCPGKTGRNVSKHQGCPDNDGDNVPEDGSDDCPGKNARKPARGLSRNDRNDNGCPDVLRLHGLVAVRKTITALTSGVQLNYLTVKGVPNGSRVVCRIGRRACPRTPIRNSSAAGVAAGVRAKAAARNIKLLGSTHLGFGTKIEVRVTAKYATGEVYRLTVVRGQNGFGTIREFEGCTNPGSRKVRPKGCK